MARLAPCIGSMANRDCMEINELYKIPLTVLMMNIANTATSATSGKPDEQAALAFPLRKKFISSQEGSQPLVLLLVCLQIPQLPAAKTRRENNVVCTNPRNFFFRKLLWIANT